MNYSITLTEEQYSVLEGVFAEHNWTFNAICLTDCETNKQTKCSKKAKRKISAECEHNLSRSPDSDIPLAELEQKVRNEELNVRLIPQIGSQSTDLRCACKNMLCNISLKAEY